MSYFLFKINLNNQKVWLKLYLRYSWYGQMLAGEILPGQMFGQILVINSWDISDKDKSHQDKWCLDKRHNHNWNLFKMVPETYPGSFVKIGLVTPEITRLITMRSKLNYLEIAFLLLFFLSCVVDISIPGQMSLR